MKTPINYMAAVALAASLLSVPAGAEEQAPTTPTAEPKNQREIAEIQQAEEQLKKVCAAMRKGIDAVAGVKTLADADAAAEALKAGDDWYEQLNAVYGERRRLAEEIMDELGCTFDPRQRGMFLWGRIPDSVSSSEALADALFYEARVFLTPGFIFGKNGERYVRISLCAKPENLRRALGRIKEFNPRNRKI